MLSYVSYLTGEQHAYYACMLLTSVIVYHTTPPLSTNERRSVTARPAPARPGPRDLYPRSGQVNDHPVSAPLISLTKAGQRKVAPPA